jgi:hypothetical protein
MVSISAGASPGALLRLSTNDAPTLASSLETAFDLARKPTWTAWERDALGVTKLDRTGARASAQTGDTTLQAAWASRDGELDIAAGLDASSLLALSVPQRALSADAQVAGWMRSIGNAVVWAAVARPLMLNTSPRNDPALVALVRTGRTAQLRIRVTGPVIRQLFVSF